VTKPEIFRKTLLQINSKKAVTARNGRSSEVQQLGSSATARNGRSLAPLFTPPPCQGEGRVGAAVKTTAKWIPDRVRNDTAHTLSLRPPSRNLVVKGKIPDRVRNDTERWIPDQVRNDTA